MPDKKNSRLPVCETGKRQESEFAHLISRQQYITAHLRLSTEGFQNE